jgi:hypothetical protein
MLVNPWLIPGQSLVNPWPTTVFQNYAPAFAEAFFMVTA